MKHITRQPQPSQHCGTRRATPAIAARRTAGNSWRAAAAAAGLMIASPSAFACSACGCLLNSDWASQGYRTGDGWSMDLRYDFSNQDQLRSGTGTADRNAFTYPAEQEVQRTTISRTTTLAIDYAQGDWGVNVKLPYLVRTHDTIAEGDTELSFSRSRSIGDLRIVGRYKGFAPDSAFGVTFGLKLPTGATDVNFSAGPQQGAPLDRGLQPGTGTTDLLLGAFHFGQFSETLGYFVQGDAQLPLNSKDAFKPGKQFGLSAGLRYMASDTVQPQLQLNVRHETRESGANADGGNSGFTVVHLSPGVNVQVGKSASAYAFVQLPVHQKVNGLQLQPRYNLTVGVHWMF